ncbi:MAG: recombinase family protein [Firmicutes bacterium]|nr:recombinase family protein [Bacillota bacterium]
MRDSGKEVYSGGLYLRLSREDRMQNNESMSISNQRKITVRYATENKIEIVEIYIDDGYSGVSFERPAFNRMIKDLENGKINCVIVKDMSRLGRNDVEANRYYEDVFLTKHYRFIAIDDNVDTLRGYEQHATFKNMFNSMYPRDISQKTHSAYMALAHNGEKVGKAPYGLKHDPDNRYHLIIDEEAAKVIRYIFSLAMKGMSRKKIARILREEKILSPAAYAKRSGCKRYEKYVSAYDDDYMWCDKTVGQILMNEFYIGSNVANTTRRSFKTGKCEKLPREEWVIVPDVHEAIISKEVFYRVRDIFKSRRRGTKMETVQLFAGLVKCKDCSRSMNYTGGDVPFYTCGTYRNKGKKYCSSHRIRYEDVYNCVLQDIRDKTSKLEKNREEFIVAASSNFQISLKEETRNLEKRLKELTQRYGEIDILIQKTYENSVLGNLSGERMSLLIANYENEQIEVKEELEKIKLEIKTIQEKHKNVVDFTKLIEQYIGVEKITMEMALELIEKIEIGEKYIKNGRTYQDIDISYRFVGKIAV